jgi:hypothetical protein
MASVVQPTTAHDAIALLRARVEAPQQEEIAAVLSAFGKLATHLNAPTANAGLDFLSLLGVAPAEACRDVVAAVREAVGGRSCAE